MKCPNKDLLSAYLDQEIGSPWDAAIAGHLAACASCREKVAAWQDLSGRLKEAQTPDIEAAARRVRQRIDLSLEEHAEEKVPVRVPTDLLVPAGHTVPFLRRQVLLPVPVLAGGLAAMFVLVAGLFFFAGKSGNDLTLARAELESLKTVHVYYPVQDQAQFLQMINSKSSTGDVVFDLPSSDQFKVIGQPEVVYVMERK
jgi:anti-sigma factor RsiW